MALPEDELKVRPPLTRPLYDNGIDNANLMLTSFKDTSFPLVSKLFVTDSFLSPQVTVLTSPEKVQLKFTVEPTNPVIVFP